MSELNRAKDNLEDKLDHEQTEGRKDQAGGMMQEAKGHVKKAVGDLTDNHSLEAKGQADILAGKARKMEGNARSESADALEDKID